MKFLLTASMPVKEGNDLIKQGKLASTLQTVLGDIKPDAVYFGLKNGMRTMYMIVDMQDASQIPGIAEPLFLSFNGVMDFIPVMQQQDLMKAGPALEAAAKKYGS